MRLCAVLFQFYGSLTILPELLIWGPEMSVSQLGYLGISTTSPDMWLDIAINVLGMQLRDEKGSGGEQYLRMDGMHHRVAIHKGDKDDLLYAGWQVADEKQLESLCNKLAAQGITVEEGSEADCVDRGVHSLFRFRDPEGYANELFVRPLFDDLPFQPSLPIAGFVTGDLGLGHVVRHCKDHNALAEFYRSILGFKTSDHIVFGDMDATFMRCNKRHHSLALINESIGHSAGDTNHFMIEMQSITDVGRIYDIVLQRGLPIIMTLGQHSNDETISFYFVSPSGFGVEVGAKGLLVDDENWSVKTFSSTRIWGHLFPHERENKE